MQTPHTHRLPAAPDISVLLPNGQTITSSHTATLALHPSLPLSATTAHIFPALSSGSLLSVGLLCDHGCTADFHKDVVTITLAGEPILQGFRSPTTQLWTVDLTPATPLPVLPSAPTLPSFLQANALLPSTSATIANRVAFFHASLFSPTLSTWCAAIDAGHFSTWPSLTSAQVRRHPPPSVPMIKGHLNQQRANLNSTKPKPTPPSPPTSANNATNIPEPSDPLHNPAMDFSATEDNFDDFVPTIPSPPATRTHNIYTDCGEVTGQIFSDLTGRFIQPSSTGNSDMLIVYDYDSNFIHVEPMPNKSGPSILAAYTKAHALFTSRGLKPSLQRLDNEASLALQSFMEDKEVDFQLAPPHVHRRNAAERAIQTFKHHFIAGLCSTDRNFPLHLWDRLLPQALISLNLLRTSRLNPRLSAYAQVHGAFDYNRTPLAPPGTRVLVHVKPKLRETWAPHAVEGWYTGPALKHYRCYKVYVGETSAERIADTLTWFPSQVAMPLNSSLDLAAAAAQDLLAALLHPSDASPLSALSLTQRAALFQLADIFAAVTDLSPTDNIASDPSPPISSPPPPVTAPPGAQVPRVPIVNPPALPSIPPLPAIPAPVPADPSPPVHAPTYVSSTQNPNQRRRQARAAKKLLQPALDLPPPPPPLPAPPPLPVITQTPLHPHNTRASGRQRPRLNCVLDTSDLPSVNLLPSCPPSVPAFLNLAVIDPNTGATLEYPALLRGPDAAEWEHATSLEIGRLTQGCLPRITSGSETMVFIPHTDKPADRVAHTYAS